MAADKKVNYTEAQTAELIDLYQGGMAVEDIATQLKRAVRSVRSKLVREGVYVAPEKPVKAVREEGPTKKELLRDLEALWDAAPVDGLQNATKEALTMLIAHLEQLSGAEEESDE